MKLGEVKIGDKVYYIGDGIVFDFIVQCIKIARADCTMLYSTYPEEAVGVHIDMVYKSYKEAADRIIEDLKSDSRYC